MNNVNFVLENEIFSLNDCLKSGSLELGYNVLPWNEDWFKNGSYPLKDDDINIFHGSLINADFINQSLYPRLISFCDSRSLNYYSWFERFQPVLLNGSCEFTTVDLFLKSSDAFFDKFHSNKLFVRPQSALKPFSGRVLHKDDVKAYGELALDYGFYYEDKHLPIVISEVRSIKNEWRFVCVDSIVVAGSSYTQDHRPVHFIFNTKEKPVRFAQEIAETWELPESVCVMDVCECSNGDLKLVEFNAFSGSDLYACDGKAIAKSLVQFIQKS